MNTAEKIDDKFGKIITTKTEEQVVSIAELQKSIEARQSIINQETANIKVLQEQIDLLKDAGVKEDNIEAIIP